MEYDSKYFTEIGYKDGYPDNGLYMVRATKIINIAKPTSVLDVGCARGWVVKHLLELGVPAWGIDPSEWCKKNSGVPRNHIVASADDIPFEDKSFDLLYCEGVLEHINEIKIPKVMSEFNRVSKRRMLQISLLGHYQEDPGHICIKDLSWWFNIVPEYTWIFAGDTGTQDGNQWIYKG